MSILMILLTLTAFAQKESKNGDKRGMDDRNPQEMAEKQTERLTKALTLNTEQSKKVKDILTEELAAMQAARKERAESKEGKPSKEERAKMMEARKAMQSKHQEKMKAVLTPAQFEKWTAMKEERGKEARGGKKERTKK